MPDPVVIGTIAVCIYIASQIAIRSKNEQRKKNYPNIS